MKEIMGEQLPSIVENPFKKDCITNIRMFAGRSLFDNNWYFRGNVEFRNGNTKGEQKFEKNSFDELYIAIANFCKTL